MSDVKPPRGKTVIPRASTFLSSEIADNAALYAMVVAMASYGARPGTVSRIFGLPATMARRLCKRAHGRTGPGRTHSSVAQLMVRRELHLEASLFLRFFAGVHQHSGALSAASLVESYGLYLDAAKPSHTLPFEAAVYAAEAYLAGSLRLHSCSGCGTRFCVSTAPLFVRAKEIGRGSCPSCRARPRR